MSDQNTNNGSSQPQIDPNTMMQAFLQAQNGGNMSQNELMAAIFSAMSSKGETKIKIGNQTISLKVDQDSQENTPSANTKQPETEPTITTTKQEQIDKPKEEQHQSTENASTPTSTQVSQQGKTNVQEQNGNNQQTNPAESADNKEFSFNILSENKKDSAGHSTEKLDTPNLPIIKADDQGRKQGVSPIVPDSHDKDHFSFSSSNSILHHLIEQSNHQKKGKKERDTHSDFEGNCEKKDSVGLTDVNTSVILKRENTNETDLLKDFSELKDYKYKGENDESGLGDDTFNKILTRDSSFKSPLTTNANIQNKSNDDSDNLLLENQQIEQQRDSAKERREILTQNFMAKEGEEVTDFENKLQTENELDENERRSPEVQKHEDEERPTEKNKDEKNVPEIKEQQPEEIAEKNQEEDQSMQEETTDHEEEKNQVTENDEDADYQSNGQENGDDDEGDVRTHVDMEHIEELQQDELFMKKFERISSKISEQAIAQQQVEQNEPIPKPNRTPSSSTPRDADESIDADEERDHIDVDKELTDLMKDIDPRLQGTMMKRFSKYIDKLKSKEKKLQSKEKQLQDLEKEFNDRKSQTQSSTQYSQETGSTGFHKPSNEIQMILDGILSDSQKETPKPDLNALYQEASLHFAFLFSGPLVLYYTDSQQNIKKSPIYMEVDYRTELDTIKSILRNATNQVKFRSFCATQSYLGECLNMKPRAIHFCGHGVKNNQENFGYFMQQGEGDFLIFEDEEGKADFMSCKSLKNLLKEKKLDQGIDFVFVASCHSQLVGQVFKDAGAKHVICVARDEAIMDKACQEFTKHFYQAYFTGNYPVCEAFRNAKQHLKSIKALPPGEENKFVLLVEESVYQEHICSSIFPSSGQTYTGDRLLDLTPKPTFHKIPSRIEHFIGRHIELHDLVRLIRSQRFVTIKGIPGIGKSSLCREGINFLYHRQAFKDGIIYLSLNGCDSIEGLISALDSKLGYLSKRVDSKKEAVGNVISQIANHISDSITDCLIVLDDSDRIQHNERGRFREFIEGILIYCPKIKFLITSRSPIGGGLQEAAEKVLTVSHLDSPNSRELFYLRAPRAITESEINDLINYQLSSSEADVVLTNRDFLDPLKSSKGPSSGTFHDQLCQIQSHDIAAKFENHHLMQILGGHPQAICLASALLGERSMTDLYRLLLSSSRILDVLKVEDLGDDEAHSVNSMEVSLNVSLDYLNKKHKDSVKLFGVLGMLPGGVQEQDFDIIWGKNWQEHANTLARYSLILKNNVKTQNLNQVRYSLYPFMIKYAEERLQKKDKYHFGNVIIKYLRDKAREIFIKIGNLHHESHVFFDIYLKEEPNFKSAIKRELEEVEKKSGVATPDDIESDASTLSLSKSNLEMFKKITNEKYSKRPRKISKEAEDVSELQSLKDSKIFGTESLCANLLGGNKSQIQSATSTVTSDASKLIVGKLNKLASLSQVMSNQKSHGTEKHNMTTSNIQETTANNCESKSNEDVAGSSQKKMTDIPKLALTKTSSYDPNLRRPHNNYDKSEESSSNNAKRETMSSNSNDGLSACSNKGSRITTSYTNPFNPNMNSTNDYEVINFDHQQLNEDSNSHSITFQNTDNSQNQSHNLSNLIQEANISQDNLSQNRSRSGIDAIRNSPIKTDGLSQNECQNDSGNQNDLAIPELNGNSSSIKTPRFTSADGEAPQESPQGDKKISGIFKMIEESGGTNTLAQQEKNFLKLQKEFSLGASPNNTSGITNSQPKLERAGSSMHEIEETKESQEGTPEKQFQSSNKTSPSKDTNASDSQQNTPSKASINSGNPLQLDKKSSASKNDFQITSIPETDQDCGSLSSANMNSQNESQNEKRDLSPNSNDTPVNMKMPMPTSLSKHSSGSSMKAAAGPGARRKSHSTAKPSNFPSSSHATNQKPPTSQNPQENEEKESTTPTGLPKKRTSITSKDSKEMKTSGTSQRQKESPASTITTSSKPKELRKKNPSPLNQKDEVSSQERKKDDAKPTSKDTTKHYNSTKSSMALEKRTITGPSSTFGKAPSNRSNIFTPDVAKEKITLSCHLAVLYGSILFLLRRYHECEKAIAQGLALARGHKDKLAQANFLKLKGCLNWIKKEFDQSFNDFVDALDLFKESGCSLGQAICDAATGYLKAHMLEETSNSAAVKRLENAYNTYKNLNHKFGVHYLSRWLSIVMKKMPNLRTQSRQYSEISKKALNTKKVNEAFSSKHQAGTFVLRWQGDVFSIFTEIAAYKDVKPVKRSRVREEEGLNSSTVSMTNSGTAATTGPTKSLKRSGLQNKSGESGSIGTPTPNTPSQIKKGFSFSTAAKKQNEQTQSPQKEEEKSNIRSRPPSAGEKDTKSGQLNKKPIGLMPSLKSTRKTTAQPKINTGVSSSSSNKTAVPTKKTPEQSANNSQNLNAINPGGLLQTITEDSSNKDDSMTQTESLPNESNEKLSKTVGAPTEQQQQKSEKLDFMLPSEIKKFVEYDDIIKDKKASTVIDKKNESIIRGKAIKKTPGSKTVANPLKKESSASSTNNNTTQPKSTTSKPDKKVPRDAGLGLQGFGDIDIMSNSSIVFSEALTKSIMQQQQQPNPQNSKDKKPTNTRGLKFSTNKKPTTEKDGQE